MNLIPARDMLFVLQDNEEEKTASGLYLPDEQRKKPSRGTVVVIGPDCKELKPGDVIRYNKGAGVPPEENSNLMLIREDDYLYKIIPDENSASQ